MTILQFEAGDRLITQRQVVPAGTRVRSRPVAGTSCQFRTCTDVILYPFRVHAVSDGHTREKSIVRIDLTVTTSDALSALRCDQLDFHLSGDDDTAQTLYLWLAQYLDSIRVEINGKLYTLPPQHIGFPGFRPDEALLPTTNATAATFDGYRLLYEYFVYRRRFYFFSLNTLQARWPSESATQVRIEFHFTRPMPEGTRLRRQDIALYCAPAVNLFTQRATPIRLAKAVIDQPVQVAQLAARTYEIFSIDAASAAERDGDGHLGEAVQPLQPLESLAHKLESVHERATPYYRTRIESGMNNADAIHRVSFVHADGSAYSAYVNDRQEVILDLTCSNRDLPQALAVGDICLPTETTPSHVRYRNITPPTPSYRPVLDGAWHWMLISNLSLNYLLLQSAEALKAVIRTYDGLAPHDIQHARATRAKLDSIGETQIAPLDILIKGQPVRGTKTVIKLDPSGFTCNGDMYLFGTVLSHFFALSARVNAFHQLETINMRTSECYRWPWRAGQQPMI